MRILYSTVLRLAATTAVALLVLAVTAPWSGVIRCADGLATSTCTSTTFTAVGSRAWDLLPSLLLTGAVAATVWMTIQLAQNRTRERPANN